MAFKKFIFIHLYVCSSMTIFKNTTFTYYCQQFCETFIAATYNQV